WIDPEEKSTKRPHGSLSEVRQFLANIQAENQQSKIKSDPEVAIAILRSTPAVIDTWLERYNRKKLHQQPAEGEWSANEIFWHLADFEERIYKPQWQNLLRNPDQVVPHIETSSWAEERDYASRKPEAAYARFLESRTASLELIEALLDKGFFELSIDHTVFSKAKISELVDFSARHDRLHLRQSVEALKF
ncbi:MAG: DinB family protein, partial [Brevefilum sp.]